MWSFTAPTSLRLRNAVLDVASSNQRRAVGMDGELPLLSGVVDILGKGAHASHPDFGHLVLLVFEAVLEVVCVSLPGYIVARQGMFDADAQKFVANLNVQLFTPCLVFTKLASQLNADKLIELAIIPIIFVAQTCISWGCATVVSKICGFPKRQANFVTAMGVFGNSNSLPISLVISLSKTISGLHWDQVPGDNDDEVAARGILYLLIFQQLGQLLRWSWGYNVLLKPPTEEEERIEQGGEDAATLEEDEERYRDDPEEQGPNGVKKAYNSDYASGSSGTHSAQTVSVASSPASSVNDRAVRGEVLPTPTDGNVVGRGPGNMLGRGTADRATPERQESAGHITQFPSYYSLANSSSTENQTGVKSFFFRVKENIKRFFIRTRMTIATFFSNLFRSLPVSVQKVLATTGGYIFGFFNAIYQSMNPPLWAMLIAVIVASVPALQHLFFDKGTFISNSVTRAVAQSGGVAVPLILVVLGANLARNTLPRDELATSPEELAVEKKLLYASLISRMLLPTLIMAPFLAVFAKFVPVSILDDPIFVIVCFLLTGAPSALQLAQICQLHNVFMGVMSKLLFQSYVVWILPSTLVLVMLALEVVEWAQAS